MWVLDKRHAPPYRSPEQPGLQLALDVNRCAVFADMASGPLGEVHDEGDVFWTLSSLPWATFDAVSHSRLGADRLDERIREKQAYYRRSGRGLVWWSTPHTTPSGLVERLLANGFVHRASFPGMVADLHRLPEPGRLAVPAAARVERVADVPSLRDWARTCLVAFGAAPDIVEPAVAVFRELALRDGREWRCYLATVDGRPAASAGVLLTGGVAGVYWVGTLAEFRRRGLGAAVTAAVLRDAYGEGYRVACLTASALGLNVYARLGFERYADFHTYRWPP